MPAGPSLVDTRTVLLGSSTHFPSAPRPLAVTTLSPASRVTVQHAALRSKVAQLFTPAGSSTTGLGNSLRENGGIRGLPLSITASIELASPAGSSIVIVATGSMSTK